MPDQPETAAPSGPGALSTEDVLHLARLARLELTEAEVSEYARQMSQILEAVDSVREVAADDVVGMSHPQPLTNVMRPDVVTPGLSREQALAAAPEVEDDRFRVPRILDEE